MLLQTRSVLRNAVRLLQLFEAVQQRHPLVCVNVVGGGCDFAKVKPLLLSLSRELPSSEMATLRAKLAAHGNGIGQLGSSLSDTICHTISVHFNPAASDVVMEAAIKDIMDKLDARRRAPPDWSDSGDGASPTNSERLTVPDHTPPRPTVSKPAVLNKIIKCYC